VDVVAAREVIGCLVVSEAWVVLEGSFVVDMEVADTGVQEVI
jgi:hypothetical protein